MINSPFLSWVKKQKNPEKFGITPLKASVVYGPSCTGKKTITKTLLEELGYNVITISEKSMLTKKFMTVMGVAGENGYIVDLDNIQGFPNILPLIEKDNPLTVFVCTNPFAKAKRKWREVSKKVLVVDTQKDALFREFFSPSKKIGKHDIQKEIPPWEVIRHLSKFSPLQEKIDITSFHKDKLNTILWNNCHKLRGKNTLSTLRTTSTYLDNLGDLDIFECRRKTTQSSGTKEYILCGSLLSFNILGIKQQQKLSYKTSSSYVNAFPTKKRPLFEGERFDLLKRKRKGKRKKRSSNTNSNLFSYPPFKF